jgi:speckle-type POZ protein
LCRSPSVPSCPQVKAEEDLYLSGSENTIRRVAAETNYSCLMLKTQRFSSLFRHYAKYHGLRKDELEYYFVNLLENEDTPESVHLQRGDTIMVRKKRKPPPPEPAADDEEYFKDLRDLLSDEEHMDCIFVLRKSGNNGGDDDDDDGSDDGRSAKPDARMIGADEHREGVRAHRAILTARGEYFRALFHKDRFLEGKTRAIDVDPVFTYSHVRYVLEFLYTNRIQDIGDISTDDLLCLLHLSDRWMLRDLKRVVEHELIHHMSLDTVARMYGATEDFHAQRLARACIEFIMGNLRQLAGNPAFEEDMKNYPLLCIPVLKAAADLIPDGPPHKKQRLLDTHTASSGSHLGSSPVPDSDA